MCLYSLYIYNTHLYRDTCNSTFARLYVPLCASIASGSTECAAEELGGRSASILDEDENAFFQDPLEAFSGSGDVCAGEVIRAAFEHETRDLMAAYQVVVKLVVKLVVDVRGGDVVHTRLSMRREISRQPTRS